MERVICFCYQDDKQFSGCFVGQLPRLSKRSSKESDRYVFRVPLEPTKGFNPCPYQTGSEKLRPVVETCAKAAKLCTDEREDKVRIFGEHVSDGRTSAASPTITARGSTASLMRRGHRLIQPMVHSPSQVGFFRVGTSRREKPS